MVDLVKPSFAAGELAPEMHGRTDIGKYYAGVARARNAFVYKFGGIANRAGFRYLEPVSGGAISDQDDTRERLIPFIYSEEDAYLLIFGNNRMRVMRNDLLVADRSIENITSSGTTFTKNGHGLTTGQFLVFELDGQKLQGRTFEVKRLNANSFQLLDWITGTVLNSSEVNNTVDAYDIYEIETPYTTLQLAQIKYVQRGDVMTLTHPEHAPRHLTRFNHADWNISLVQFSRVITGPSGVNHTIVQVEVEDEEEDPEPETEPLVPPPSDPANGVVVDFAAGTDVDYKPPNKAVMGHIRYGIAAGASMFSVTFTLKAIGFGPGDFTVGVPGATVTRTAITVDNYKVVVVFASVKTKSGVAPIHGTVSQNILEADRVLKMELVDLPSYKLSGIRSLTFTQGGSPPLDDDVEVQFVAGTNINHSRKTAALLGRLDFDIGTQGELKVIHFTVVSSGFAAGDFTISVPNATVKRTLTSPNNYLCVVTFDTKATADGLRNINALILANTVQAVRTLELTLVKLAGYTLGTKKTITFRQGAAPAPPPPPADDDITLELLDGTDINHLADTDAVIGVLKYAIGTDTELTSFLLEVEAVRFLAGDFTAEVAGTTVKRTSPSTDNYLFTFTFTSALTGTGNLDIASNVKANWRSQTRILNLELPSTSDYDLGTRKTTQFTQARRPTVVDPLDDVDVQLKPGANVNHNAHTSAVIGVLDYDLEANASFDVIQFGVVATGFKAADFTISVANATVVRTLIATDDYEIKVTFDNTIVSDGVSNIFANIKANTANTARKLVLTLTDLVAYNVGQAKKTTFTQTGAPVTLDESISVQLLDGTNITKDRQTATIGVLKYTLGADASLSVIQFTAVSNTFVAADFEVGVAGADVVRTEPTTGNFKFVVTFKTAQTASGSVDILAAFTANAAFTPRTMALTLTNLATYDLGVSTTTTFTQGASVKPLPPPTLDDDITVQLTAGTDINKSAQTATIGVLSYVVGADTSLSVIEFTVVASGFSSSDFAVTVANATIVRTNPTTNNYKFVVTFKQAQTGKGTANIQASITANTAHTARTLALTLTDLSTYDVGASSAVTFTQAKAPVPPPPPEILPIVTFSNTSHTYAGVAANKVTLFTVEYAVPDGASPSSIASFPIDIWFVDGDPATEDFAASDFTIVSDGGAFAATVKTTTFDNQTQHVLTFDTALTGTGAFRILGNITANPATVSRELLGLIGPSDDLEIGVNGEQTFTQLKKGTTQPPPPTKPVITMLEGLATDYTAKTGLAWAGVNLDVKSEGTGITKWAYRVVATGFAAADFTINDGTGYTVTRTAVQGQANTYDVVVTLVSAYTTVAGSLNGSLVTDVTANTGTASRSLVFTLVTVDDAFGDPAYDLGTLTEATYIQRPNSTPPEIEWKSSTGSPGSGKRTTTAPIYSCNCRRVCSGAVHKGHCTTGEYVQRCRTCGGETITTFTNVTYSAIFTIDHSAATDDVAAITFNIPSAITWVALREVQDSSGTKIAGTVQDVGSKVTWTPTTALSGTSSTEYKAVFTVGANRGGSRNVVITIDDIGTYGVGTKDELTITQARGN